jgi:hypothetical protein
MAGKRKRNSSPTMGSSPEAGPSTLAKKSRVQEATGPESRVDVVWELVGSDKKLTRAIGELALRDCS